MIHRFCLFILLILSSYVFGQSQKGGFINQWDTYDPTVFGQKTIVFDSTDMISIDTVPNAGIHPRIYFGPSEIPALRNRINTSTAGQEVFKQIHAYTTLLHLGYGGNGTYNHNSSYGSDDFGNRRVDNAGKWDSSTYYENLMSSDPTALDGTDNKRKYLLASIMALEAFECLINEGLTDPDTGLDYDDRAEMLGVAMSNWAQIVLVDPSLSWSNYNLFGGVHMAYAYDLNFNSMTINQQDSVRMALAQIVPPNPRYGHDTESYATTSNWVGLNTFELLTNFAIEGENGYNPTLTKDYMRSYRNFLTYGWYESGAPYEGLGKNYQFVTSLFAAAKRGYSLLVHPHVKAYGENFLPAITQPYGHAFIGTDVWGGSGWDTTVGGYKNSAADILGLKYILPSNTNIDFVWRNYIEKSYTNDSEGYVYQQISPATSGYHNYLLVGAIFAQDYNVGDWSSQNETTLDTMAILFPERGLSVLRSGFDEDALMVHFHARQDMGGHTHGDRNNFTLSALGRTWIRYTYGSAFQETQYHSCLLIDDLGIPLTYKDGVKARQPGTVLSFERNALSSQITADATYAYSYEWHWETRDTNQDHSWLGTDNWTEVSETWNDFRMNPGIEDYFEIPFYDFANWNSGGDLERIIKRPYNIMERVFRNVALVNGQKPYVLITDDVQKDANIHNYKWLAQVANDLIVTDTIIMESNTGFRNDLILADPNSTGRLLIRVLNNNGQCAQNLLVNGNLNDGSYKAAIALNSDAKIQNDQNVDFTAGELIELEDGFDTQSAHVFTAQIAECMSLPAHYESLTPGINGNAPITRVVVEANTVAPDFKILLYPFEEGNELPITNWNTNRDILEVTWSSGSETISYSIANGLTNVSIN